jgi:hypothetical protein
MADSSRQGEGKKGNSAALTQFAARAFTKQAVEYDIFIGKSDNLSKQAVPWAKNRWT